MALASPFLSNSIRIRTALYRSRWMMASSSLPAMDLRFWGRDLRRWSRNSGMILALSSSRGLMATMKEEEEEEEEEEESLERADLEKVKGVALVACVMALCNADRVVMSVAAVPLAAKYGWSTSFIGIVQSSFLWGYLASSLFGGALADRYGGKRVLGWGAALWSLTTLLTPCAAEHSASMLLAMRVLFGLSEGVAMPSMSALLSRWFSSKERASAVGISMAGFHLGNVFSLLLTPLAIARLGVNGSFGVLAMLGFLWLPIWISVIRDDDRRNAAVISIRHRGISAVGFLLSKSPTWAIILANFANNWGYFVLLSWMPVYFKTVYNVNLKQAAWFSALPWGVMALSGYIAGAASDSLIKSGHPLTHIRKIMQSIGFIGPGVALLCLNRASSPSVAVFLLAAALSSSSFSQAGFLLNMQDIAPKHAGFLHGISNSAGTLAAIISTVGAGYFVEWMGSFQAFLTLTSIVYFGATVFWNRHATAEQVFF